MAHPHRWALAFLGSGLGGSYANRRRLRGVVSLSHAIASLEARKSPDASPDLFEHLRNGDTLVVEVSAAAWPRRNQPDGRDVK
jgi:hypothetical protein